MSMNDDILRVLYSEEELEAKCAELGAQISKDYEGKNLLLVSVLKGAVVFMTDLMRHITVPCSIDFMPVSRMSSTISKSLPARSASRSFTIFTTPLVFTPLP